MPRIFVPARLGLAVAVLLAACTDNPMAPPAPPEPIQVLSALTCTVQVQAETMSCEHQPLDPQTGARLDRRIVGGQDLYVKLRSAGTSYDGASYLTTFVSLQNLMGSAIGTLDGVTADSINVFFAAGPTITSGGGMVDLDNEDGTGTFTAADQPYFLYSGVLQPYEISAAKEWRFLIGGGVGDQTFSFTVYVSAKVANGAAPLFDVLWQGDVDSDWSTTGNWRNDAVPGLTSAVTILADSLFPGSMPVLTANAQSAHLRVGFGSTLGLAGFGLEVAGNLDAPGTISGGMTTLSGASGVASGTVDALAVTGSYALQGATRATGAVSVSGSLNLDGNTLTIAVP